MYQSKSIKPRLRVGEFARFQDNGMAWVKRRDKPTVTPSRMSQGVWRLTTRNISTRSDWPSQRKFSNEMEAMIAVSACLGGGFHAIEFSRQRV